MDILSPRHLKIANWSVLAVLVLAGYLWLGPGIRPGSPGGGPGGGHQLPPAASGPARHPGAIGARPQESASQAKAWFAARQMLRFFALLAIIYLLVGQGWVNIFGLLVGLSTVVLTLMLAALHETIKLKNKEANPSHGTPHSIS